MYCCYCLHDITTEADFIGAVFVQNNGYESLYACKECAPNAVRVIVDTDPEDN